MTKNFNVIIPKTLKPADLPELFRAVYDEYKGKFFAPAKFEISTDRTEGYVEVIPSNNDFSDLLKHGTAIQNLFLKTYPALHIFFPPDSYGFPTISIYVGYLNSQTYDESIEAQKTLEDTVRFAKLIMKHSGASYFYGGVDAFGEITSSENEDVGIIYCRGKGYVKMLQTVAKNHLGVKLNESQIEKIVNEVATVKHDNGFITVQLFRIEPGESIGPKCNRFYQAVKELTKNEPNSS